MISGLTTLHQITVLASYVNSTQVESVMGEEKISIEEMTP